LKIISALCSEQCNVKHIWEYYRLPQSTVSRHLAQLKDAGIITGKRVGNEIHYEVINPSAEKIIKILE
jgi:DNA-binding transcriptional ArsR family regulator